MKQLLHRLDTGETMLIEAPAPSVSGHNILVETRATVISSGTEQMLVEFGRANWLEKARQQPDKVREVMNKLRTDGIGTTLEAVRAKLEAPITLGYCQAGVVVEAGDGATEFSTGDRVVTNGPHAEYVRVPQLLAARIPDGVNFEAAAFTPVAAIGLQGIRLLEPTLGETVVVVGLGLIGLLSVQLLRANGCHVIGVDRDGTRLALAEKLGAHALEASSQVPSHVHALTRGLGADAVLMTLASAADEPIHQAAEMSRKRGRIVLVGVTGLNLRRDDFYKKELSFQVSCSYGPGRYDPSYEEKGQDYPLPFVRWTEKRNFEAVLGLMASGRLDPLSLVTHRFAFEDAPAAYEVLGNDEPSLGIVLTFPDRSGRTPGREERTLSRNVTATTRTAPSQGSVGVIGAGNFAIRTLLPVLKSEGARLDTIVSGGGTSGAVAAEKFGFARTTTEPEILFETPEIDTVFVLTRHDSHAKYVIRGLEAGKHVFVEKPLALTLDELERIADAAGASDGLLMVGFNRRFARLTQRVKGLLTQRVGPLTVVATINAGAIAAEHWTQDIRAGGGRLIGEACHWIDLSRALADSPIAHLEAVAARDADGHPIDDIAHLTLSFADGSTSVIHYLANGSKAFPRERIECFFDGKIAVIDNWRRLKVYGLPKSGLSLPKRADKGHEAEIRRLLKAIRDGGSAPIPLAELIEVSRWSILAGEQARSGSRIRANTDQSKPSIS